MEVLQPSKLNKVPTRNNVLAGTQAVGYTLHGLFDVESAQADLWSAEKDGQIAIAKIYRFKTSPKLQNAIPAHNNITPLLATGTIDGSYVEVTPFRENGNLANSENKKLFLDNTANCKILLEQSVNALSFLHEHGIQHRDLKPDNMLLKSKAPIEVELTDFGSASFAAHTMVTMARGTPAYLAPEAATGLYSNASDFWSIGAIVFELYFGRPLYKEINGQFTAVAANFEIPGSASPEMLTLFHGLLEKKWEERWGTKEIKDWLSGKNTSILKKTTQTSLNPLTEIQTNHIGTIDESKPLPIEGLENSLRKGELDTSILGALYEDARLGCAMPLFAAASVTANNGCELTVRLKRDWGPSPFKREQISSSGNLTNFLGKTNLWETAEKAINSRKTRNTPDKLAPWIIIPTICVFIWLSIYITVTPP